MDLQNTHVKLMASDFLSITQSDTNFTFSPAAISLSRVEIVGVVTSHQLKPHSFLKFILDDGTACVPCVLWLNHLRSSFHSRRCPQDVRLIAGLAEKSGSEIEIGVVARVRGRITTYRGALQVAVSDVVIERDPNAEMFHWLECLRLAHLISTTTPPSSSAA